MIARRFPNIWGPRGLSHSLSHLFDGLVFSKWTIPSAIDLLKVTISLDLQDYTIETSIWVLESVGHVPFRL